MKKIIITLIAVALAGCFGGVPCDQNNNGKGGGSNGNQANSNSLDECSGISCSDDFACSDGVSGDRKCCDLEKGWCVVCGNGGPNS